MAQQEKRRVKIAEVEEVKKSQNLNKNKVRQAKEQLMKQERKSDQIEKQEELVQQQREGFFKVYKSNKPKLGTAEPNPFDQNKLTQPRKSLIKADEVARMRIPSDEILIKDEDSLQLSQSVTCPICLMILQLPYYECQGCSNGFCTICLQSWWKKAPNTCAFKCSNGCYFINAVQFKTVKRSNTYNAVMGMLKTKCQYCREQYTISDISTHIIKVCSQVPEFCRFCSMKLTRKAIEGHEKQECEERPWKCEHCKIDYSYKQKEAHDEVCKQKLFPCTHQDCAQLIKRRSIQQHSLNCDFKPMTCVWCETKMSQKEHRQHVETCEQKKIKCVWCGKICSLMESSKHQLSCELKKDGCRLCHEMVLTTSMQQHMIDCMFENMIEMKNKNETLEIENVRLKQKIMMLEGILEETIANNKSSALKAVSDMREQDKKVIEKDLLRLDNSIRSVEKLKKEEFAAHMKFPHLIQSWCPICRQLQKKFKGMLEPLLEQRKQVLVRIAQLQRFSLTPQ